MGSKSSKPEKKDSNAILKNKKSMKKTNYDVLKKILLLGESGVGKTALCHRYTEQKFDQHHISTIGVDFQIKKLERNGKRVQIQIWDSAGQERFRTITSTYYRGVNGIMLVYDVSDRESFENIEKWLNEISKYTAGSDVVLIIVGNKSDLDHYVTEEEVKKVAERVNALYIPFVSAKTGENVEESFTLLIDKMLEKC